MHHLGLALEDCVVPGIVMTGSICQFCAIYLLENNFPVFVTLSPQLSPFSTFEEQEAVVDWRIHLVLVVKETAAKLLSPRVPSLPFKGV
jgi:hypothetical protein